MCNKTGLDYPHPIALAGQRKVTNKLLVDIKWDRDRENSSKQEKISKTCRTNLKS